MAFSNGKGDWVSFDADSKEVITAKQRLDKLLKNGYRFEACISQSAVVDSFVFGVVFIKSDEHGIKLDIKKRKEISKLPLGKIIKFLVENSLIESPLLGMLEKYNTNRVSIVHHTVRGEITVDFLEFYKLGEQIIIELNKIYQDILKRKNINHNW